MRLQVFADRPILERAYVQVSGERLPTDIAVLDRGQLSADQATPGVPSRPGALAQVAYLEAAVAAARSKSIGGLVTAPISKTQATSVGFAFPGHTEFLAARLGAADHAMMFAGPKLRVMLATVHCAVADVVNRLTVQGLVAKIEMAARTLSEDFGIKVPRIAVAALNPHAGEGGMFGDTEQSVIAPAIDEARRRLGTGAVITGPAVPDAVFRDALVGRCDLVVAMYHDQGLIPVKLVDFEDAVNVTVGLPIVRTSPDHGVAYDIAGRGTARSHSFIAALELCAELVERRARRGAGPETV